MFVQTISRKSRIKEDTAIALILSVFFAVGIVLLTMIQHKPLGNQSGLDKFLFGQTASLVSADVKVFAVLAFVLLLVVAFTYKELKALCFDRGFAESLGMPMRFIDTLLTLLIVLVVTTGLQAVGVVLMAAMLITPAAAARLWTNRLSLMLVLAGVFGALAGSSGVVMSTLAPRMPTGPWIVMAITFVFAVSLLISPQRGMLSLWLRHRKQKNKIQKENILLTFARYAEEGFYQFSLDQLRSIRNYNVRRALYLLRNLQKENLLLLGDLPETWVFTQSGKERAFALLRRHRLWELYLSRYLDLSSEHVHTDAENIEHILTLELEAELVKVLENPTHDPHHHPIPPQKGKAYE